MRWEGIEADARTAAEVFRGVFALVACSPSIHDTHGDGPDTVEVCGLYLTRTGEGFEVGVALYDAGDRDTPPSGDYHALASGLKTFPEAVKAAVRFYSERAAECYFEGPPDDDALRPDLSDLLDIDDGRS